MTSRPLEMLRNGQVKGSARLPGRLLWIAHVETGRVVRVEGAKDHPITRGTLSAKVDDYPTC